MWPLVPAVGLEPTAVGGTVYDGGDKVGNTVANKIQAGSGGKKSNAYKKVEHTDVDAAKKARTTVAPKPAPTKGNVTRPVTTSVSTPTPTPTPAKEFTESDAKNGMNATAQQEQEKHLPKGSGTAAQGNQSQTEEMLNGVKVQKTYDDTPRNVLTNQDGEK